MNIDKPPVLRAPVDPTVILALERPHPRLMTYYFLCCLVIPPLFPILILPNYFRYHTMRYRFDAEGISMRWGILFRREVLLNYSRIQDIHIQSNLIERWLGLGRVLIQTASGSSNAEMTIEGFLEFEAIRDFLYARMRGAKEKTSSPTLPPVASVTGGTSLNEAATTELISTLRAISAEVRALREDMANKNPSGD